MTEQLDLCVCAVLCKVMKHPATHKHNSNVYIQIDTQAAPQAAAVSALSRMPASRRTRMALRAVLLGSRCLCGRAALVCR